MERSDRQSHSQRRRWGRQRPHIDIVLFNRVQKLETNPLEGSITAAFSGPKRTNELNEFDLKYLNYRFVALNTLTNLSRAFRP